ALRAKIFGLNAANVYGLTPNDAPHAEADESHLGIAAQMPVDVRMEFGGKVLDPGSTVRRLERRHPASVSRVGERVGQAPLDRAVVEDAMDQDDVHRTHQPGCGPS
ncbi:hypothetical protein, partial [Variovorax sp. WDL1]